MSDKTPTFGDDSVKVETETRNSNNNNEVNAEEPPEDQNLIKEITSHETSSDEVKPQRSEYKKVGFIVNPVAGKGRVEKVFRSQVLPALKTKFAGVEICAYETKKKGDGVRLARKYLSSGFDYIVSVGGDGTNHEVVNGVMQELQQQKRSNVIVGFLPLGSGCDFVRTFQMTADDIDKNLNILQQCFTIPCDVGVCQSTPFSSTSTSATSSEQPNTTSRYYLNSSSFGATGAIMKAVNASGLIISHEFTYTYHTLMTSLLTPNSVVKYRTSPNGDLRSGKFYLIAVVNGQYFGNGCWINPYGRLEDGKVDVVTMGDLSFKEVLTSFNLIKTGDHFTVQKVLQDPPTAYFQALPGDGQKDDVVIECDGELSGKLPATWSVRKHAFKLVVPEGFTYKKKQ
jgi:diacylglycerol kinase family enzyme